MRSCPSRFTIVQYHKQELPSEQNRQIKVHLDKCIACKRSFKEILENESIFNRKIDKHTQNLLTAIAHVKDNNINDNNVVPISRLAKSQRRWHLYVPIAAAAMLTLALYFLPYKSTPQIDMGYKGGFAATVVAKRDTHQFRVENDNTLRENDALQFVIQTATAGNIYIFSVDTKMQITPLYPFNASGDSSAFPIDSPGEHTLDDSIVLDSSKGTEYIAILFSPTPFKIDSVNQYTRTIIEQHVIPKHIKDAQLTVLRFKKE